MSYYAVDWVDGLNHYYGVLKPCYTLDYLMLVMKANPSDGEAAFNAVSSLFDGDFSFKSSFEFDAFVSENSVSEAYTIDYYHDTVFVVDKHGGGVMYLIGDYDIGSLPVYDVGELIDPSGFIDTTLKPVFDYTASNSIVLALLSVTFFSLGIRVLRRVACALGRGC